MSLFGSKKRSLWLSPVSLIQFLGSFLVVRFGCILASYKLIWCLQKFNREAFITGLLPILISGLYHKGEGIESVSDINFSTKRVSVRVEEFNSQRRPIPSNDLEYLSYSDLLTLPLYLPRIQAPNRKSSAMHCRFQYLGIHLSARRWEVKKRKEIVTIYKNTLNTQFS